MAHLSVGRPDDGDDRGQVILIAAFALAVTFVALALVTNSAIFAENLASRGETSGAADAARFQYEVRQDVGAAMEYANRHNNTAHSTAEAALVASVDNQSGQLAQQRAIHSRVTSVDGLTVANQGTLIRQTADGEFTADDSTEDWFVVKDVERTRAYTMTISDHTELESTGGSDPFTVHVEAHPEPQDTAWEMRLLHDNTGGDDDVVLEVERPSVGTTDCRVEDVGGPVTVDVTGARLNGTYCAPLDSIGGTDTHFATGLGTPAYNISYENGDNIEGRYSMVVDNRTLGIFASEQRNYDTDGDMQVDAALYAVTVDLEYRTQSLTYESTVRVAPGEAE